MKAAIVCEGSNDKAFLTAFIEHLKLKIEPAFYILRGKSFLFDATNAQYQELKRAMAAEPHRLLFVVDADDAQNDARYGGFENTQHALQQLLADLQLDADCSSYILCDPLTQTGYLESLILSTISASQRSCIESFLACSEFPSKENHKAILNSIYKTAYPNAPFDFSHPHFDELKSKLLAL